MKRLLVIGEYFPPRLGGGRRLFELLTVLSSKYDIRAVVIPPAYVTFIRRSEDSQNQEDDRIVINNMVGYKLGLPNIFQKIRGKSFVIPFGLVMFYFFFKIVKKMIKLKPSLVIIDAPSPYSGFLGFLACKLLRIKFIIEYNDIQALYAVEILDNNVNFVAKNVLSFIEHQIIKGGQRATAISGFVKDYAEYTHGRKDLTVIPNGADLELFNPRVNGDELRKRYGLSLGIKLCVYAGRIEKCVGADTILQTATLLKSRRDIKFMIVGEGDSRMTNELSKLDNVIMTGLVSRESVPKYLAAADMILVPLSCSVASHGISPLKLFESLAMGKIVIATNVTGVREIITNNYDGILLSNSPDLWASAIIELSSDPKKCSFLGENAIRTAQNYSWNKLAEKFDEVIISALD